MDIYVLNMRKTSKISILTFKKVYLMKKLYLRRFDGIILCRKKIKIINKKIVKKKVEFSSTP